MVFVLQIVYHKSRPKGNRLSDSLLAVVDIVIAGAFLYFIFQFKRTERIV